MIANYKFAYMNKSNFVVIYIIKFANIYYYKY